MELSYTSILAIAFGLQELGNIGYTLNFLSSMGTFSKSLSPSVSLISSPLDSQKDQKKIPFMRGHISTTQNQPPLLRSKPCLNFQISCKYNPFDSASRLCLPATRASSNVFLEEDETRPVLEDIPIKFLSFCLLWALLCLTWFGATGVASANADSIRASGFGLKIASFLQRFGCPAEAIVLSLATLPVVELRGAIPVGYWMLLNPFLLNLLSIFGNMLPVPFIILYLKPFASFLGGKNKYSSHLLNNLIQKAKEKAGPVAEFQWLGLMLFVAIPFPGTGAWTGAAIASVLDMPFWPAFSANLCGVVMAAILVNLLVNLGLKYAIMIGIFLFFFSGFAWKLLRKLRKS